MFLVNSIIEDAILAVGPIEFLIIRWNYPHDGWWINSWRNVSLTRFAGSGGFEGVAKTFNSSSSENNPILAYCMAGFVFRFLHLNWAVLDTAALVTHNAARHVDLHHRDGEGEDLVDCSSGYLVGISR
jgi:hypothetical protein